MKGILGRLNSREPLSAIAYSGNTEPTSVAYAGSSDCVSWNGSFQGAQPCQHLDLNLGKLMSDFWPAKLLREIIYVVLSHQVYGKLLKQS